jgi:hypothetical protein
VRPPVNAARGEALATVAGEPRRLCLTLGGLAELEGAWGLHGWEPLAERLRALSPGDVQTVLAALLRGGGEGEVAAALDRLPVTPQEAADAVAAGLAAAALA